MAVLEIEHAANPLPGRPAPRRQFSMFIVDAPATIAHHETARAIGEQNAKGIDAVLQGHGGVKKQGGREQYAPTTISVQGRPGYPNRW
jgi:hypothetical protein